MAVSIVQPASATTPSASLASRASIELFAGGGGLALGLHQAGFEHLAVNEVDTRSLETLELNLASGRREEEWPIIPGDVREHDWGQYRNQVSLLAGGAPCQPFSIGGAHQGDEDPRNLWPAFIDVVRQVRPLAVIGENVRGLTRPSFRPYLDYICNRLSAPHAVARENESWQQHDRRLRNGRLRDRLPLDEQYVVDRRVLLAADYGVPQLRYRLFVVAFRADVAVEWAHEAPFGRRWRWPTATHSKAALLAAQEDGSYWHDHGLPPQAASERRGSRRTEAADGNPDSVRWRTLRDAIRGSIDDQELGRLPEPVDGRGIDGINFHVGIPGARLYKGHSGNPLDWPAKTIKAGVHGVPGGEHVVLLDDGSHRYLTVRECARVQTFPDDWHFAGPRSEASRQIGNAVPVRLARIVAAHVRQTLEAAIPEEQESTRAA